jgi:hypothetical protein
MLMASACIDLTNLTQPSSTAEIIKTLSTGDWKSASAMAAQTCGNFKWTITELTGTTAKGTFSATCQDGITLTGTAQGELNGEVLNYSATGTAKSSAAECPYTLTGTANKEGASYVRVNYTVNTCIGTFSGSELLQK